MQSDQSTVCIKCGAHLPAGITFRQVFDTDGTLIGNKCWNKCRNPVPEAEPEEETRLAPAEVLKLIEPANPHIVFDLGKGEYEARWDEYSTPFLDTNTIQKKPGVTITQELCRAGEPYAWMMLRFKLELVEESVES